MFHQNLLRINVWRGGNRQLDSNSHICILFFVFSEDFSFQLLYKSIHIITVVCFTISFIKIYWELVSKSFKNNVGQLLWQIWLSRVTHYCHGHNSGVAQFPVCVTTSHRRCHSVTLAISWDIGFEHSTLHRQRKKCIAFKNKN